MEKENFLKILGFLGLTFLASFFLGRIAASFLNQNFFEFWENFLDFLLKFGLSFIFVGLTFSLPALFLKKERLFLVLLFNGFAFLLGFFLFGFQEYGVACLLVLIFFIFQYSFFKKTQNRAEKFLSFSPSEIFTSSLKGFFLGLSLLLSLSFYFDVQKEMATQEFVIPQDFFEKIMKPADQIFRKSLEEGLKSQMGEELKKTVGTSEPEEVLKFLEKEAKETAQEGTLRQKFGLKPEVFDLEKTKLPELKEQIENQIKPFLGYLPSLAALSLFFTLNFVISFIMILLSLLLPLLFKVFLGLRIFKIAKEQEVVERITL